MARGGRARARAQPVGGHEARDDVADAGATAAAVAAEAAFLRVLDGAASDAAPAWAGARLRRAVRRGAARFPLRVPVVEVERRGEGLAGGVGARR